MTKGRRAKQMTAGLLTVMVVFSLSSSSVRAVVVAIPPVATGIWGAITAIGSWISANAGACAAAAGVGVLATQCTGHGAAQAATTAATAGAAVAAGSFAFCAVGGTYVGITYSHDPIFAQDPCLMTSVLLSAHQPFGPSFPVPFISRILRMFPCPQDAACPTPCEQVLGQSGYLITASLQNGVALGFGGAPTLIPILGQYGLVLPPDIGGAAVCLYIGKNSCAWSTYQYSYIDSGSQASQAMRGYVFLSPENTDFLDSNGAAFAGDDE